MEKTVRFLSQRKSPSLLHFADEGLIPVIL